MAQDPLYGGYLLRSVAWLPDATYSRVCECYVSYVRNNFSLDTVVVFDGYESKNSTKVAEQLRRASKAVSRDLIFDGETKTVTTQTSFFANRANKSRLIEMVRKQFEQNGISSKQAEADADSLITSTGLTLAKSEQRPVVIIGNDTDLLVILVSQITPEMSLYMCGNNPPIIYDIQAIHHAIGHVKTHLIARHHQCRHNVGYFWPRKKEGFSSCPKG